MATILMSIGFSVDYTAHISYHYYKGDAENTRARLKHALSSIAWPMLQAGLSTLISVLILIAVHAYMVDVFVKTVFLVVFLGLAHGLVILPVVLAALPFHKSPSAEDPWKSSAPAASSTSQQFDMTVELTPRKKSNKIGPIPAKVLEVTKSDPV
uniref:Uncharacterized protein n=1 Tax=Plectus sambesii TaxID=2011161 RepID=A0A914USM9_9BILA